MTIPALPIIPASPWAAAFGSELNFGQQTVTAEVANGAFNSVGGNVTTAGVQNVGDAFDLDYGYGPDINVGVQTVTAAVGNGAFNSIGGDVTTVGEQNVGDVF